jgi:hypothetical protein
MALSAQSVWEVRPGSGSDTNGGGFVAGASGTDFSQQNSANSGGNNSSTTDGVAAGSTTFVSASASFTAAIVGNIIYLSGGSGSLAAVRRQVTGFTNATTITLDASVATGTGITMNVGGALATVAEAFNSATACNTVWIKNTGTYTVTSTLSTSLQSGASNTGGTVFMVIGYGTTRGDATQVTWTTSTNSVNLVTFAMSASYGGGFLFRNINFTCTAGTPGAGLFVNNNGGRGVNFSVFSCRFSGFAIGISAQNFGNTNDLSNILVENTEITSCTGYGFENTAGILVNCYIHDNAGGGVFFWGNADPLMTFMLLRCTIYNNTGVGINSIGTGQPGYQLLVINCNLVSNTSKGINFDNTNNSGSGILFVENSIFTNNGDIAINSSLTLGGTDNLATFVGLNNAFYNNTGGNYANLSAQASDITLTGSPFNSPSTGDFSLNGTAGQGAACKGMGFQGTLAGAVGGATSASIDVGAVQSTGSGGGGGTVNNYIVSKNITQVIVEDY